LPEGLGDVFSVRAAREQGVTESRLRAADLERTFRGARSTGGKVPDDNSYAARASRLRARCREYQAIASADFAFSHSTAAQLHGIVVPERMARDTDLHVAVSLGQPRRRGIRTHRLNDLVPLWRDGMPVIAPTLAWLQLAPDLTIDELVVAGDCLVRRKRPMAELAEVASLIEASRGIRGVALARAALELMRAGTDSPRETTVRLLIVAAGLPEPVVGHTVIDADGYWVGTPDLAYVRERIAIEYQGAGHAEWDTFEDDVLRIERFRDAGWTVIQITNHQLRDPRSITERIRRALVAAGTRV
jgi:hypothetical protein